MRHRVSSAIVGFGTDAGSRWSAPRTAARSWEAAMRIRYGKLIRDRIPEIMDAEGVRYEVVELDGDAFRRWTEQER